MTIGVQKQNLTKMQAAIEAARAKIEAVDSGLRPEVRAERIAAIRQKAQQEIDEIHADIQKRTTDARNCIPSWSQAAVRRRAKFHDDPSIDAVQRTAMFETLKRASTAELIGYLEDAVREKSLAKAELVRLEFGTRDNAAAVSDLFNNQFALVVDVQAQATQAELEQIAGVGDYAQVLVREFVSGRSDPAGRMAGARMAGMVPVAENMKPTDRADQLRGAA